MSWLNIQYLKFPFLKTTNIQPQNGLGENGISICINAGYSGQGTNAIAIGISAGYTNQIENAIAIGYEAGQTNQGTNAIAIGFQAGSYRQRINAVAIGNLAGKSNQTTRAIAIANSAGETNQGRDAIAIGWEAGNLNQGDDAIALGARAGEASQFFNAISIGAIAGQTNQGTRAIAIGLGAGIIDQNDDSIVLNGAFPWPATSLMYRTASGFFVRPFRAGQPGGSQLNYNSDDSEFYPATSSAKFKNTIKDLTIDTSIVHNLKPRTFIYNSDPGGGTQIGYIAEEVKMIHYNFARYNTPNGDPMSINFDTIVVFLAEELKKLKSTKDTLTQQKQDLLERLIVLENK